MNSEVEQLVAEAIDLLERARSVDHGHFENRLTENIDRLGVLHQEIYEDKDI